MVVIDLFGGSDALVTETREEKSATSEYIETQPDELHYETQLELVVVGT